MERNNGTAAAIQPPLAKLWTFGEPTLDEIFADPIVHTMMAADGVELDDLCALIGQQHEALRED